MAKAEQEQAKQKFRSCSKKKQWTELVRDTSGRVQIAKIIDLGQQMSSRKKSRKKISSENKPETSTGVAKLINMF